MLEFALVNVFRPLILFMGMFGNSISLFVLMRKKLDKLGPRDMYRYLFLVDLVTIVKLVNPNFGIKFSLICKTSVFTDMVLIVISPWIIGKEVYDFNFMNYA